MHELINPSINFLVFATLLVVFLRKPLVEFLKTRREHLRVQIDEARAQKLSAEKKLKEFEQKLQGFEVEAKEILTRANNEAVSLKKQILADAQSAADRIVKDSEAMVETNLRSYKDQLRKETLAKAFEIAESMVRERLSTDDQRRIVTEYVSKVQ